MEDARALPFVTRQELKFEHGASFALELVSYSNVTERIDIIGLTQEGPFTFQKAHAGDGAAESDTFAIPDFPISVSVHTDSVTVRRGQFWATLYLTLNETRVMKLCSGYISRQAGIAWPASQTESEIANGGHFKLVTSADPAAGAELTHTVPTNELWIVHAVVFDFVTDANAANRRPHVLFDFSGSGIPLNFYPGDTQLLNETRRYTAAAAGFSYQGRESDDLFISIPPNLHVGPGGIISTDNAAIQVGDNYSAMEMWVEAFFQD